MLPLVQGDGGNCMTQVSQFDGRLPFALAAALAAFVPASAEAAQERVIHSFNGSSEGGAPEGELLLDAQGNLYGTNESGGSTSCGGGGCGTVFKVAPNGRTKVLHVFTGDDGAFPIAGVVADSRG